MSKTCITIYTDASVCGKTGTAAWACWLKWGRYESALFSGVLKQELTDSTTAEMQAIANALAIVKKRLAPTNAILVVTTDSQNAIMRIEGKTRKRTGKRRRPDLETLTEHILKAVPEGCELRMKKVKAHNGKKDGARSYVNGQVDRACRTQMRKARKEKEASNVHNA